MCVSDTYIHISIYRKKEFEREREGETEIENEEETHKPDGSG